MDLHHPTALLSRLEKMVVVLLGAKFEGADGIWNLQTDLLQLQQEIQAAITQVKRGGVKDSETVQLLHELRTVRWHARRFGDAMAWLLLQLDRQVIYPLGRNQQVPIAQTDAGGRGMLALAGILAERGWGFPLLHDVTHSLRIGDITFISVDRPPNTVEIKTRVVNEREEEDGSVVATYESVTISVQEPPDAPIREEQASRSAPRSNQRTERQVKRLRTAFQRQTAEGGAISEIENDLVLTTRVEDTTSQSGALRRVARKARREGFATEAVDNTFLYAGIYDKDGIDPDRLEAQAGGLSDALLLSGILFTEDVERNSVIVSAVPVGQSSGPHLYMPYYLLDLPRSSIVDMLNGRMVLLNIVNFGRIAEALVQDGFEVEVPAGKSDLSESMVVQTEIKGQDGKRYRVELHNLRMHMDEMTLEFRPLRYLIDRVGGMSEASEQVLLSGDLSPTQPGHQEAPD